MIRPVAQQVRSYGLQSVHTNYVLPTSETELLECVELATKNNWKICPKGSALSFSDVCLISGNMCLDITGLNRILSFDKAEGILVVEPGVLVPDILKLIMPAGWYLAGLTGSLGNTVAGNISNDVNGKDSWLEGNFGANVLSIKLLTADGKFIRISAAEHMGVFNAVIGGMGLLGIIAEVTLKLIRIPSYHLETLTTKVGTIDGLLHFMGELHNTDARFAYAWTDPNASGKHLGRGIIETAKFIEKKGGEDRFEEGFVQKSRIGFLQPATFWRLFRLVQNPLSMHVANSLKYHLANTSVRSGKMVFPEYQYPMVKHLPQWNLKYRPEGFREIQILFPKENFRDGYAEILSVCKKYGQIPELCAVRRHKNSEAMLSFSGDGYSMTINYAIKSSASARQNMLHEEIIEIVLKYAGKVYLGKHPFITPGQCKAMYPKYDAFIDIKKSVDPDRTFWSDAAERVIKY